MDQHINRKWLVGEIKKLKVMGQVVERANSLKAMMLKITRQKISQRGIHFSEFFTLAVGLRFVGDLAKKDHLMPPVDIYARRRGEAIIRRTLPSDVDNLLLEIKKYWGVCYPLLEKVVSTKKIFEYCDAAKLLDLIISARNVFMVEITGVRYCVTGETLPVTTECTVSYGSKYLITPELFKMIRYCQYGLDDEEEAEVRSSLPLIYSLAEVAIRWGTNAKNVIAACMGSEIFWAYINITNVLELKDMKHWDMSVGIDKKILQGDIDPDYKYPFQGFARLAKESNVGGGYTLKYFYSDSEVRGERGRLTLIWVDPPLCDRVLGVYAQHLEAEHDITPSLFFMQEEIRLYEQTDDFIKKFPNEIKKTLNSEGKEKQVGQLLGRPAIKKMYAHLSQDQWNNFFKHENENGLIKAKIPGATPRQDRYVQQKVEEWLIETGRSEQGPAEPKRFSVPDILSQKWS